MNSRKGMDLAISTIILLVIGIAVLVGIIVAVRGGFGILQDSTTPFADTAASGAVREACNLACSTDNALTFCCKQFTIEEENIKCTDDRLMLDCSLDCSEMECRR